MLPAEAALSCENQMEPKSFRLMDTEATTFKQFRVPASTPSSLPGVWTGTAICGILVAGYAIRPEQIHPPNR